jgi:hypothetical protein
MARRPIEEALYIVLTKKQFRFMRRHGAIDYLEINNAVQQRYPMLCEDTYTCPHYHKISSRPEWHHIVESVLGSMQKKGIITYRKQDHKWIFP